MDRKRSCTIPNPSTEDSQAEATESLSDSDEASTPKRGRKSDGDSDYVPSGSRPNKNRPPVLLAMNSSSLSTFDDGGESQNSLNPAITTEFPLSVLNFVCNSKGIQNSRVIVPFDPKKLENNSLCHEFAMITNNPHKWYCLGCKNRSSFGKLYAYTADENFIVFGEHWCKPITFEDAKRKQELIINNKINKIPFKSSFSSQSTAVVPSVLNEISSTPAVAATTPVPIPVNQVLQQPMPVVPIAPALPPPPTPPHFFVVPSSIWLQHACENLECSYDRNVYKLWALIEIDNIPLTAKPGRVKNTEGGNGFNAISLMISNKENPNVKKAILKWFIKNYKSLGLFQGQDFAIMSQDEAVNLALVDEMQAYFFEALTKIIHCKIGIFENDTLIKYGDWNINDNRITLLFKHDEDQYQIITSLIDRQ